MSPGATDPTGVDWFDGAPARPASAGPPGPPVAWVRPVPTVDGRSGSGRTETGTNGNSISPDGPGANWRHRSDQRDDARCGGQTLARRPPAPSRADRLRRQVDLLASSSSDPATATTTSAAFPARHRAPRAAAPRNPVSIVGGVTDLDGVSPGPAHRSRRYDHVAGRILVDHGGAGAGRHDGHAIRTAVAADRVRQHLHADPGRSRFSSPPPPASPRPDRVTSDGDGASSIPGDRRDEASPSTWLGDRRHRHSRRWSRRTSE